MCYCLKFFTIKIIAAISWQQLLISQLSGFLSPHHFLTASVDRFTHNLFFYVGIWKKVMFDIHLYEYVLFY